MPGIPRGYVNEFTTVVKCAPATLLFALIGVVWQRSVEGEATKLDLEHMNLLLRNMPPTVDAREVRLA